MTEGELRSTIDHMAHWGFDLLDRPHAGSPGFSRLLIAMRPVPTHAHFDPEQLSLAVLDGRATAGQAIYHRESPPDAPVRLCPGYARITDRIGKRLVFFLYGGKLQSVRVTTPEPYTLFIVHSPAPILGLGASLEQGQENQLADSTEALFARLRARWRGDRTEFLQRLTLIGPLQLYASCIESLWAMYRCSPTLPAVFGRFYALLQRERQWLARNETPGLQRTTLEQLMADLIALPPAV